MTQFQINKRLAMLYIASEKLQLLLTVLQLEHYRASPYEQCEDLYTRIGANISLIRHMVDEVFPKEKRNGPAQAKADDRRD